MAVRYRKQISILNCLENKFKGKINIEIVGVNGVNIAPVLDVELYMIVKAPSEGRPSLKSRE